MQHEVGGQATVVRNRGYHHRLTTWLIVDSTNAVLISIMAACRSRASATLPCHSRCFTLSEPCGDLFPMSTRPASACRSAATNVEAIRAPRPEN